MFHHFVAATQFFLFKGVLINTAVQKLSLPIKIPTGFHATVITIDIKLSFTSKVLII